MYGHRLCPHGRALPLRTRQRAPPSPLHSSPTANADGRLLHHQQLQLRKRSIIDPSTGRVETCLSLPLYGSGHHRAPLPHPPRSLRLVAQRRGPSRARCWAACWGLPHTPLYFGAGVLLLRADVSAGGPDAGVDPSRCPSRHLSRAVHKPSSGRPPGWASRWCGRLPLFIAQAVGLAALPLHRLSRV